MMSHPAMLRRAVAGGMRLMVAHAVTNFAGCLSALNFDRGQTARCADDMEDEPMRIDVSSKRFAALPIGRSSPRLITVRKSTRGAPFPVEDAESRPEE